MIVVAILENAIAGFIDNVNPIPLGTDHPSIAPFGAFQTKDEKIVIAIGNEKLFKKFCVLIDDLKMLKDKNIIQTLIGINVKELKERINKNYQKNSKNWIKIFGKGKFIAMITI